MKYLIVILTIGITSYVSGASDSEPPTIDFRPHFQALRNKRYPLYENGEHWKDARDYISNKMRYYGNRQIIEQFFNTSIDDHNVTGVNLIGLSEGDSNRNGSIIVVGADYDSNLVGNQLKNNAGGVACLLETMHLFYDKIYWNQYHLNYTVIFVAFDLNTREYHKRASGPPGSYFFIHEWLLDYLGNDTSVRDFRGAIILDSVTTYNTNNESQSIRDFEEAMPIAYKEIKTNGSKGDFIGMLYNSKDESNILRNAFVSEYNKDKTGRPFRLQEMEIHLGLSLVSENVLEIINHQSHWMFWTNILNRHLPVYLLFDTDGDNRVDPTPDACTEISCSVDEFLTDERINFMTQTTRTLFNTLMSLQTSCCDKTPEEPDSAAFSAHSSSFILLTTSVAFVLARFLKN